jgi:sugar phosphate isomerase/epimerase
MRLARRAALRGGAALAFAAAAAPLGARSRTSRVPLGLADITVARELARDYSGTLRQVAAMGYSHFGFRLAGYGGGAAELPAPEKARLVREAGLEVGVVRLGVAPGADHTAQIAEAAAIGARIVALTTAPVFFSGPALGVTTRAAFDAWLPTLAALGARCREAGLTLAYHNHAWDLQALEGETPLDIMARAIPPGDLSFELDLGWCWYAGVAPLDLLARLGARVVSMHLKDIDRSRGKNQTDHAVVIGSGEMGYASLLPRIRAQTSAIGYIEVDAPEDGLAAAAEGARFFRDHAR